MFFFSRTSDFDVEAGVEKQVLGFQIPMDNMFAVAVGDRGKNLLELLSGFFLIHPPVGNEMI